MIPEAAVEAAAKVVCAAGHEWTPREWDDGTMPERHKRKYRDAAHLALEAAAPHMLKAAYDLGFKHGSNESANPYRPTT